MKGLKETYQAKKVYYLVTIAERQMKCNNTYKKYPCVESSGYLLAHKNQNYYQIQVFQGLAGFIAYFSFLLFFSLLFSFFYLLFSFFSFFSFFFFLFYAYSSKNQKSSQYYSLITSSTATFFFPFFDATYSADLDFSEDIESFQDFDTEDLLSSTLLFSTLESEFKVIFFLSKDCEIQNSQNYSSQYSSISSFFLCYYFSSTFI